MNLQSISRYISLILRHKPEVIGIALDEHGWANVNELITKINDNSDIREFNRAALEYIVKTDNKQRYSFNDDKTLIRANQGHSIPVDVELIEKEPPCILYHGTGEKYEHLLIKMDWFLKVVYMFICQKMLKPPKLSARDMVKKLFILSIVNRCTKMDTNFTYLKMEFG